MLLSMAQHPTKKLLNNGEIKMPNIKDILVEKTYKNDTTNTERRIYETLKDDNVPKHHHRTAKLLALLIAELEKQGVLSEEQIDSLLLETIP